MSCFGPCPGASGGEVIEAPSPSDGKGARFTSPRLASDCAGARAGSAAGAAWGGGAAGLRRSGPDVERFPNTLVSGLRLTAHELFDERRQHVGARPLGLGASGERLGELTKRLRRTMSGRNLSDHLPVIGGGAEQCRLERNRCYRLEFKRLGEVRRL